MLFPIHAANNLTLRYHRSSFNMMNFHEGKILFKASLLYKCLFTFLQCNFCHDIFSAVFSRKFVLCSSLLQIIFIASKCVEITIMNQNSVLSLWKFSLYTVYFCPNNQQIPEFIRCFFLSLQWVSKDLN